MVSKPPITNEHQAFTSPADLNNTPNDMSKKAHPTLMPIHTNTYPSYTQLDYFNGPNGSYVGTPMPIYSTPGYHTTF
jgi:hypothetical protein